MRLHVSAEEGAVAVLSSGASENGAIVEEVRDDGQDDVIAGHGERVHVTRALVVFRIMTSVETFGQIEHFLPDGSGADGNAMIVVLDSIDSPIGV